MIGVISDVASLHSVNPQIKTIRALRAISVIGESKNEQDEVALPSFLPTALNDYKLFILPHSIQLQISLA